MGSRAFKPGAGDLWALAGAVSVVVVTQGRRSRAGSQLLNVWGWDGGEGDCPLILYY